MVNYSYLPVQHGWFMVFSQTVAILTQDHNRQSACTSGHGRFILLYIVLYCLIWSGKMTLMVGHSD